MIITGHDGKDGLKLIGEELTAIFTELGNQAKGIIWGEGVWQKGEVASAKAMEEAYRAGCAIYNKTVLEKWTSKDDLARMPYEVKRLDGTQ